MEHNVQRFYIDKIGISVTSINHTIATLENLIKEKHIGYVCVTEERTTYIANHNKEYCAIQNNSILTVPDGMPLVWIAHNLGYKDVERVSGPDLLSEVLKISREKKYSHYFYGSTSDTVKLIGEKLAKEYPEIEVKGLVSPPFQPIEDFDIAGLALELNTLKPDFFWCGLGAPKQEKLISLLQPKLDSTICIGVGLAFNYLADNVKRAPEWAQKNGLEGFYRLAQQPQRISFFLIRRYLYWLRIILITKIKGRI